MATPHIPIVQLRTVLGKHISRNRDPFECNIRLVQYMSYTIRGKIFFFISIISFEEIIEKNHFNLIIEK